MAQGGFFSVIFMTGGKLRNFNSMILWGVEELLYITKKDQ